MKILLTIILLGILSILHAEEIQTDLRILPEASEYREGDLVELDLKVWPIENADLEEFKKLDGVILFNSLNITQLSSVDISENNADVVLVKAVAIVTKAPEPTSNIIHYKNYSINLKTPAFKFVALPNMTGDFYILDQSLSRKNIILIIISLVGLIILGSLIYKYRHRFKKIEKHNPKTEMQNIFNIAEKRKDYEDIYASRRDWIPLLIAETNAHREFFKIMELHQYKKDWGPEEESEVKNSFEIIRRSFL